MANLKRRIEVLKAMETLARSINNEDIFESWLMCGVADGDINDNTEDEWLECYVEEDDEFARIMGLFLRMMSAANKDGGLYVDRVVSGD